ncbi:hypothetical protein D3C78_1708870 [compost metagenome]
MLCFWKMARVASSAACWASALSSCQLLYRSTMGAGFTLPVAVMQPAPPARSVRSRNTSLPANTSKPSAPNSRCTASVLLQSPELSLMPAIVPG